MSHDSIDTPRSRIVVTVICALLISWLAFTTTGGQTTLAEAATAACAASSASTASGTCAPSGENAVSDTEPVIVENLEGAALSSTQRLSESDLTQIPRFCPEKLTASCNPTVIEVGIPCGMDEMCGGNPCLCGAADKWGDCACNGLRDVSPTVTYTSSDENVASIVYAFGSYWLVPHGTGTATITCTAELMHYQTSSTGFEIRVDGLIAADGWLIALCLGALLIIAAIVFLCIHLFRKHAKSKHRDGKPPLSAASTPMAIICLTALTAMSLTNLSGCANVKVDESSPTLGSATFSTAGNRDESSQEVDITLAFDRPIKASSSWTDDLDIKLNGTSIDSGKIAVTGSATGDSLVLSITPTDSATASSGTFALHQAQISIASKRDDGALPSVTSEDGTSTAVLTTPVTGTLPSGLAIEVTDQTTGSIADGVHASATFEVTSPAMVRALTWLSLDGGKTLFFEHNHDFAHNDAAVCASNIADTIARDYVGRFSAKASGTTVTVTATSVTDGQTIEPCVIWGVGVFGGDYDASSEGE